MELTADYDAQKVEVRQLGRSPSSINDIQQLAKGQSAKLSSGDSLSLVAGKYKHFIQFSEALPGEFSLPFLLLDQMITS